MTPEDIEGLLPYATARQGQILKVFGNCGFNRQATAEQLNLSRGTVNNTLAAVQGKAARQGWSPQHDMRQTVPEGYHIKGTSTLYDQEGNVTAQWVKSQVDREADLAAIEASIAALTADIKPVEPTDPPKDLNDDLLNVHVITDYHMGALAWRKEGGADWDLAIAEDMLVRSFARSLSMAPRAREGFIAQLGDFLHWDGLIPVTPTSGHVLDGDGRFTKVAQVSVKALRNVVSMALKRYEKVYLLCAEGNHDLASSVWLRILFAVLYENESRIEVIDSALPYYAHQHGKVMNFFHHGHIKKPVSFPGVAAAQFSKMWGETEFRYGHAGHMHHKKQINITEDNGMTVRQHRTLAAKDAHASRGAYFAERKIECVTYHKEYGEVATTHVSPEML